MNWLLMGIISAGLSVIFGAFGAHLLADTLSHQLEGRGQSVFQTGVQYQMFHSLALIALGLWARLDPHWPVSGPGFLFVIGIFLFSGSLYALSLTGIKILGAITPFGGMAFIIAWAWWAVILLRS